MMVKRTYLSPPAVGALLGMTRIAAWLHFDAGDYGPIIRRHGIIYADKAEIERATGQVFTDAHVAGVVGNIPRRIIILEQEIA